MLARSSEPRNRAERRRLERAAQKGQKLPGSPGRPFFPQVLATIIIVTLGVGGWWVLSATRASGDKPSAAGNLTYEIVKTYPHDKTAFTQGLVWRDGHLFESTGRRGESRLRQVELETGNVVREHALSDSLFAEGMTILGDEVFQLTYKAGIGIVYDLATFHEKRRFQYPGEGWGLTHDGKSLIMSNGSAQLFFLDPKTGARQKSLVVRQKSRAVPWLNELEMVDGEILANVWKEDEILRIDPASGKVRGRINLRTLKKEGQVTGPIDVLNGIAYDPEKKRLFVTGKLWPKLFEIRLKPI